MQDVIRQLVQQRRRGMLRSTSAPQHGVVVCMHQQEGGGCMLIQDMSSAFGNHVLPSTSALVPAHVTAAPSA